MNLLPQDVRMALRSLGRGGWVAAFVVGSLALAVAGNTTVFSLVDGLLFRPWPFRDIDHLALLFEAEHDKPDQTLPVSPANFLDLREQGRAFSAMTALDPGTVTLTGGDRPEEVRSIAATPEVFRVLGVTPSLGRDFRPEEGEPGHARVAILSHDLWQERFAGRGGDVVGHTVRIDGRPTTVIGVLPEGFDFLVQGVGVWMPLVLEPGTEPRDHRNLIVLGRLAPGVGIERARAEMEAVGRRLESEHPEANRGYEVQVWKIRERLPGPTDRKLLLLLQGAMVFVLLIACANIANLLLARGQARQQELAVRNALGARRGRIVGQLLVESLTLAVAGGAVGLLLGWWWTRAMGSALAATVPKMVLPAVDARVVAFSVGLTLVAGVVFGLVPALQASGVGPGAALREGGRSATGGVRRRLLAKGLVVGEVTLALVMLCGAALLVQGMMTLRTADPGFDTSRLLTFGLSLPEGRYADDARVTATYERLLERLEALPGVRAATAVTQLPRSQGNPQTTYTVDGRPAGDGPAPSTVWLSAVPGYFRALGVPLVAGRALLPEDRAEAAPVVVVNRAFAHRWWPGEDAVGRRLTIFGASWEVVGVVGDVAQSRIVGPEGPPAIVYLPFAQHPVRGLSFLVRSTGDPHALADPVRAVVGELDADLPVVAVMTLDEHIERMLSGPSIVALILAGFGALALLLAAMGIYGVLAYSVHQRTQEIGVRMAVGAGRGRVLRLVARQGLELVALGLLLGAPGVWLVTRIVAGMLADLAPVTWVPEVWVAVALVAVAIAAALLPARRASGLDPVEALRTG